MRRKKVRKSDGSNTMLEKPCCTLHCADANFILLMAHLGQARAKTWRYRCLDDVLILPSVDMPF